MSLIPGLDPIPIGNEIAPEGEEIKFYNTNGEEFIVPEAHRYGTCRPETDFQKIDHVGEGAYGKVYKAKDLKKDEIVAMKRLRATCKSGEDSRFYADYGVSQSFLREVNILKELKHENIVNLHDVVSGRELDHVFLVFEYCRYELSNVLDELISQRKYFEPPQIKCIMNQLFSGLQYLHLYYVMHRDIKVSNILFTENGCLKIADFGLSRKFSDGPMTPGKVSLWYRAPEILLQSELYTSAIDIWAAGCIFAELVLNKPLFRGNNEMGVISQIVSILGVPTEEIWPGCSKLPALQLYKLNFQKSNKLELIFHNESPGCIAFIRHILVYDPNIRFTAEKCLKHRYFKEEPVACSKSELAKYLLDTENAGKIF